MTNGIPVWIRQGPSTQNKQDKWHCKNILGIIIKKWPKMFASENHMAQKAQKQIREQAKQRNMFEC